MYFLCALLVSLQCFPWLGTHNRNGPAGASVQIILPIGQKPVKRHDKPSGKKGELIA